MQEAQAKESISAQGAVAASYGLQIENRRLASLTRRVLCLAVILSLLAVVNSILQMQMMVVSHYNPLFLLSIGFALLVPLCGYVGAQNSNKCLICCFCWCNLLGSCANFCALVGTGILFSLMRWLSSNCDPQHPLSENCPKAEQWVHHCEDLQLGSSMEECFQHLSGVVKTTQAFGWILVVSMIPVITLQCWNFFWGVELWSALKEGHFIVQSPAQVSTQGVLAQPLTDA
mmetsp:Transcript_42224/g.106360  ORF Transcript_42224/g.106360 Transcript_42224/m.106360 type:complete len:230 (-) Transcript_42224:350-1039(-)